MKKAFNNLTDSTDFNPKKALLQTRFIYFSLLAGMLFFLILVITMISHPFFKIDFGNPIFLTLFMLTFLGLPIGYYASKKHFNKMDPDASLGVKYSIYQSGLLIRLAACDGVAIFSIVSLLITNNLFSIVFFIVSMTVFLSYFPTPERIGNDIQLADSEIEQFSPGIN